MFGLMRKDIGSIQILFTIAAYFRMSLEKTQRSLQTRDFNFKESCGHAIKIPKLFII